MHIILVEFCVGFHEVMSVGEKQEGLIEIPNIDTPMKQNLPFSLSTKPSTGRIFSCM
jgi:hypothetical protein